jgi:hypothetical protein
MKRTILHVSLTDLCGPSWAYIPAPRGGLAKIADELVEAIKGNPSFVRQAHVEHACSIGASKRCASGSRKLVVGWMYAST